MTDENKITRCERCGFIMWEGEQVHRAFDGVVVRFSYTICRETKFTSEQQEKGYDVLCKNCSDKFIKHIGEWGLYR